MRRLFCLLLLPSILFLSKTSFAKRITKSPSFIVPFVYNYGDHLFISVWNHFNGPIVCTGQIQFQSNEGREHRYFYEEAPPRMTSTFLVIPENPETEISFFSHDVICY